MTRLAKGFCFWREGGMRKLLWKMRYCMHYLWEGG